MLPAYVTRLQPGRTLSGISRLLRTTINSQTTVQSPGSSSIFYPASLLVRPASAAASAAAPQKHQHDHVKNWSIERVIDVAMLPLIPVAFLTDSVIANYALIIALGAHVHWGLEAIVIDYLRPRVVGSAGYYAGMGFVYMISISILTGLMYLNYTQMPPTKAIKKLWTL